MTDFMDFQQELLSSTKEAITLAKEYLQARKLYASYYNKLTILLNKSGLDRSKKSIDNKFVELLSNETYGELAQQYYAEMLKERATYKGLELVVKSYHNHTSGLQSVMKMQISGEINENIRNKYNN